jgi:hypothetical protein
MLTPAARMYQLISHRLPKGWKVQYISKGRSGQRPNMASRTAIFQLRFRVDEAFSSGSGMIIDWRPGMTEWYPSVSPNSLVRPICNIITATPFNRRFYILFPCQSFLEFLGNTLLHADPRRISRGRRSRGCGSPSASYGHLVPSALHH